MPNLVPVDHDPFAAAAPQGSTALPAAGDPTAFAGQQTPAGMTTPGRYDPQTMRAFALDVMANKGKGAASILNNDPGQVSARSYALTQGQNQSNLDFKQKMTAPMLESIHHMREMGDAAGDEVLGQAIGPDYGALSEHPSWLESGLKTFLPDTSGEFYQNIRSKLTPSAVPGVNGVDHSWGQTNDAAKDLNLQFHHLVKGIGAGVKAIPGTKNGGTSTDADQALVLDAVGEALKASNPQTHRNILYDAENILRGRAGLQALPKPPGYSPSPWLAKNAPRSPQQAQAAAPAPQADAPASANADASEPDATTLQRLSFAAPLQAGPPQAPPEAIAMLRQNTSKARRDHFDEVFGKGASAAALRLN